jgi:chromosome segregation ATPase
MINWGEVMEAAIAATIVGGGITLIGIIVTNIFTTIKETKKVDEVKAFLSKEHDGINDTVYGGYKDLKDLVKYRHNQTDGSIERIGTAVGSIRDTMLKEEHRRETLYNSLNNEQKNIKGHLDIINGIAEQMAYLTEENAKLRYENKELKHQLQSLLKQRPDPNMRPNRNDRDYELER